MEERLIAFGIARDLAIQWARMDTKLIEAALDYVERIGRKKHLHNPQGLLVRIVQAPTQFGFRWEGEQWLQPGEGKKKCRVIDPIEIDARRRQLETDRNYVRMSWEHANARWLSAPEEVREDIEIEVQESMPWLPKGGRMFLAACVRRLGT